MSSTVRDSARAMREASCNGIVRRMVSLPRSIVGGFSRVMGHGIGRIGIGIGSGRRDQNLPLNFTVQPPQVHHPLIAPEEWTFLANFQQQYGSTHPFFYACNFMQALKIAEDENKFMFMYLHSPQHPFTQSFCRETLCSEFVVQFLDANFVCWGALADRGEGVQMAAALRPASFPCCAVVAPASGNSIAVLQQLEGPVSPAELVEILLRTVEEQGLAFGKNARAKQQEQKMRARAKEEEKIRADRRLREEQDAAYLAALKIDKEKEKSKKVPSNKANYEKPTNNSAQKQYGNAREASIVRETEFKETAGRSKDPQATQILIRFPNGERREQSFFSSNTVQSIYKFIDSLGLPGIVNYRLISSFPRRVYGVDQMGLTLKDAGLHPKATLFLELP
ncbi:plant UBX domain-containing protein 10 [Ricinus communis]|uniref:plant UBX domain-containing protein 10 n=1 Tax=Ricinus communis TaxID=3988 RepID=UPI00201ACBBD|nr:plant UBX domain-containing protein 10 [Ricinus communis]